MPDEQESFDLFGDMHPYNKLFKVQDRLPEKGRDEDEVLKELQYMAGKENPKWLGGQCSGTMYHGGMEHYAFLNKVFSLYSFVNLLQRDLCPRGTKFEAEVLAMVGRMLHGDEVSKVSRMDEQAGAITSGGTDSIFNAMGVYREWGREKGITAPELVAPITIHPAHLKAAHLLGMKLIRLPVNADFGADVDAMARAVTTNSEATQKYLQERVYGVKDRNEHWEKLGTETHRRLEVRPTFKSADQLWEVLASTNLHEWALIEQLD